MKICLLSCLSWLAPVSAPGLLWGWGIKHVAAAPAQTGFRDAVTTHAIRMRKQELSPSTTHPALHGRANFPVQLRNVYDVYYIVDLEIGDQTIPVSVDTGSSDTWMIHEPYECVSYWWDPSVGPPNCGFGQGFKGNLSGGILSGVPPFSRSYVDGTFAEGYYGLTDVTIGGVTAHNQRVALVNYTFWHGDGQTSGLLGLAYPYLTSLDGADQNQPPYDPVFTTMWKSGAIEPIFSLGISRTNDKWSGNSSSPNKGKTEESYLALGGLPPLDVEEETWTRTPIEGMRAVPEWGLDTDEKGMYIIKPDGFVIEKQGNGSAAGPVVIRNTTRIPVVVDVGATLTYLPTALVTQLYDAFDPPAQYMSNGGLYFALCNATVPQFGVQIGNSTFYLAPDDLLRQTARDPTGEWCRVGMPGGRTHFRETKLTNATGLPP
ncbi:uncharacterized protein THITE_123323 [Thermothielavioides terrestris NRRL 8126]|uniref:Peptidase A1 domain-containing protein n=1 Tax=Thermothielavioides terrestris (strain ATCC 38088 / NRRL 8126) TaxID=578455 RepID=G2QV99_THETT|nr:uncharacterized protein THITE_123323 [Thermothielavioides terrestris NRRL 8126]AEO63786.1 hypothetical protein THITE_123323 [Thermothielavioides terrestris NRRL 8126]